MNRAQEQPSLKENYYVTTGWNNEYIRGCTTMPVKRRNELEQDFESPQDEIKCWDNKYRLVPV